MEKLLIGLLVLGSFSAMASESYMFECNAKAIEAAKAIDALNFEGGNRSSVSVTELVQKKNTAKININFNAGKNRNYTVRLSKNRSGSLSRDVMSEEAGCVIDSVDAN